MSSTDVAQKTRFIDFTNNKTSRNFHINAAETQYSNISSFDIQSFERRVFSRSSIANSLISRCQLIDSSAINRDFDECSRDFDDHWIDRDRFEFLWSVVVRRSLYKSSVTHERILSVLKSFFIVDIVNEFFEWKKYTTWSKRKKMWFNDVMQKRWTCVIKNVKVQERQINDSVIVSSHSNETKRISSLIHFVACLRIMISFAFSESQRSTRKTRRKFCIDIVKKIQFIYNVVHWIIYVHWSSKHDDQQIMLTNKCEFVDSFKIELIRC